MKTGVRVVRLSGLKLAIQIDIQFKRLGHSVLRVVASEKTEGGTVARTAKQQETR